MQFLCVGERENLTCFSPLKTTLWVVNLKKKVSQQQCWLISHNKRWQYLIITALSLHPSLPLCSIGKFAHVPALYLICSFAVSTFHLTRIKLVVLIKPLSKIDIIHCGNAAQTINTSDSLSPTTEVKFHSWLLQSNAMMSHLQLTDESEASDLIYIWC